MLAARAQPWRIWARCMSSGPVPLAFQHFAAPQPTSAPPVVFVHGLFGSSANFRGIAKACIFGSFPCPAQSLTRFGCPLSFFFFFFFFLFFFLQSLQSELGAAAARDCWSVDMRNHGQSPHSSVMTYESMADDLLALLTEKRLLGAVLVGHSMGGKAVMETALRHPSAISKLVVVDVSPVPYNNQMRQAWHVLQAMLELPLQGMTDRREIDKRLQERIPETPVRQFILQNLVPATGDQAGGFKWRINLPAIAASMEALAAFPAHEQPYLRPTLFIRGTFSSYITPDHKPTMAQLFPNHKQIDLVAGHWVHAEKPVPFVQEVAKFILKTEAA
jgi:esterase